MKASLRSPGLSKLLPLSPIFRYEKLPSYEKDESSNSTLLLNTTVFGRQVRWRSPDLWSYTSNVVSRPCTRQQRLLTSLIIITGAITLICLAGLRPFFGTKAGHVEYEWQRFPRQYGIFNGIKMLVTPADFISEQQYRLTNSSVLEQYDRNVSDSKQLPSKPPIDPITFSPYPDYTSSDYLREHAPVQTCYIDAAENIPAPDVYAYPGIPQGSSNPSIGSYAELGFDANVCFDRYGRFASYGYGYDEDEGGNAVGLKERSEHSGTGKIWEKIIGRYGKKIDWRNMDWGAAQKRCYEKNRARFDSKAGTDLADDVRAAKQPGMEKRPRTAFILRTWIGYEYTPIELLTMRALINELSLKSGGEYDVHLLVHVKDSSIPIWSDPEVYQRTIEENLPRELWGLATLWSEAQMSLYYPGPFRYNVENYSNKGNHDVYRSAHFALQWFANEKHPEYDFYWNWEMDVRLTGHYYEFFEGLRTWARSQPRKGMWERSSRYWIPEMHGEYSGEFREMVERETAEAEAQGSGEGPVWGPVDFKLKNGALEHPPDTNPPWPYDEDDYEWGVGDDADLITVNPIFDPSKTDWVFRKDVTGYDIDLSDDMIESETANLGNRTSVEDDEASDRYKTTPQKPQSEHLPPRRTAIVTTALLSRRLLKLMHDGTITYHHTMFPEMIAPSVALHHGLKAVYAPHPVFLSRVWPLARLDKVMNRAEHKHDSVFGGGEHNHLGSSYYYNSAMAGIIWRRFFGGPDGSEGGMYQEMEQRQAPGERGQGTGRMCLRSLLLHPVKVDV